MYKREDMSLISEKEKEEWTQSMTTYKKEIGELCMKYNYQCPEKPGRIPLEVTYKEKQFTLIPETHGATCENPECQKRFQIEYLLETGLYAIFYPILPVYTRDQQEEYCALCVGVS
tara:strand:+ start:114 stop:461 length:348 start_codon:yes stop_codon:yes gene_type:complete